MLITAKKYDPRVRPDRRTPNQTKPTYPPPTHTHTQTHPNGTTHPQRFTDEVFNALLALNFTYEALRNIVVRFFQTGADKTQAFLALNMAFATFALSQKLVSYRSSNYFTHRIREFLSDFGPALTIIIMTAVGSLPTIANLGMDYLRAPKRFQLAGGRPWLIPLWELPTWARAAAVVPAALLTVLFFLDHNISIRVVNNPDNGMKKPAAYHLDLLVLGGIVLVSSLLGLPWMCAATIQSLNHVRSVTDYVTVDDEKVGEGGLVGWLMVRLYCVRLCLVGLDACRVMCWVKVSITPMNPKLTQHSPPPQKTLTRAPARRSPT